MWVIFLLFPTGIIGCMVAKTAGLLYHFLRVATSNIAGQKCDFIHLVCNGDMKTASGKFHRQDCRDSNQITFLFFIYSPFHDSPSLQLH